MPEKSIALKVPPKLRFSVPLDVQKMQAVYPLLSHLYVCAGGWWPPAPAHYTERPEPLDEHILIFCHQGHGWYQSDYGGERIRQGDALFVPAGEPHAYGAEERNPWGLGFVHFSGTDSSAWVAQTGARPDQPVVRVGEIARLSGLFQEMVNPVARDHSLVALYYANACLQHILAFIAHHRQLSLAERAMDERLEKALALMQKNHRQAVSVQQLAAHVGLSESHFSRAFHQKTGFSPYNWFLRLKMQEACELLGTTTLPIAEVARRFGYHDAAYFTRLFRQIIGHTPRQYRRLRRES